MSYKKLILNTNKNFEIIDITAMINQEIDIDSGIVNVFSKHSTSAIVVNE
ncbi:MAG: YjbQ family protein, partial [Methanobrevibacter sp.]|nr:YjbQ family protein [Methanobrevibacter sp.]